MSLPELFNVTFISVWTKLISLFNLFSHHGRWNPQQQCRCLRQRNRVCEVRFRELQLPPLHFPLHGGSPYSPL